MSTNGRSRVAIAGYGFELPGAAVARLSELTPAALRPEAFDAKARLGKGVRYKDRATLLALCAGRAALHDADLPDTPAAQRDPFRFGVVVSSNLGNLDTVERVVRQIHAGHVADTSSMDLPNASSNVVAASVAIRFGLEGPNLMVCSGATAGLDALELAANCIRAGRADRMLVVGVEPAHEAARRLLGVIGGPVFDGAFAAVLESEPALAERSHAPRAYLDRVRRVAGDAAGGSPCEVLVAGAHLGVRADGARTADFAALAGEAYGAEGVGQLVLAAQLLAETRSHRARVVGGGKFGDEDLLALDVVAQP